MHNGPALRLALAGWLCALLLGCSGGGGDSGSGDACCEPQPDPAQVASAPVSAASATQITVRSTDPAVDGFVLSIPQGALATVNDTVTVFARDSLPAALPAQAQSTGAIRTSVSFELKKGSNTPFTVPVQLTIPYDRSKVSDRDLPVALAYDPVAGRYEPVEVEQIDRARGFVTVVTKHFSHYTLFTIPNLYDAVLGNRPTFPPGTDVVDTGFHPAVDGFSVETFSTQVNEAGIEGNCYGLVAYAAWYFSETSINKSGNGLLLEHSYDPNRPWRDDVARELINDVFLKTLEENRNTGNTLFTNLHGLSDPATLTLVITNLVLTNAPQIISLYDTAAKAGHSVLAYAWKWDAGLSIYDPNYPRDDTKRIKWLFGGLLDPYEPAPRTRYDRIGFKAGATFFDASELRGVFERAKNDWPSRAFESVAVVSPPPTVDDTGAKAFAVPTGPASTQFSLSWNPGALWAGTVGNDQFPRPSFAHVYLNGDRLMLNGLPVIVPIINGGFAIDLPKLTTPTAMLEVAVSTVDHLTNDQQLAVSVGYQGFLRATLIQQAPFTKIAANGADLRPGATQWTCVRHNATGLLWEAHVRRGVDAQGQLVQHACSWETDGVPRCLLYTYLNNGDIWDAPSVPATVGSQCGKTGWRLPTLNEAIALVSEPIYYPPNGAQAQQTYVTWFGSDDVAEAAWTSTLVDGGVPGERWIVSFRGGGVGHNGLDGRYSYYVRLVR